jgi:predicted aldo/keto reductase-like oxidoreductase
MEYRVLGKSNIEVSRLCFGSLTISPSQANLSAQDGGELISYALSRGINFIDTAELYQTYGHIHHAIKISRKLPVICTKTYAWNRSEAEKSLDMARRELDLDIIDIVLLHEQESSLTMHGHSEAAAFLLEQKERGVIRSFGLSTHAIEPVLALTQAVTGDRSDCWKDLDPGPWQYAEIVHPLLNLRGIGLLDGTSDQMMRASAAAAAAGIGIFGMKMFGGGHLLDDFDQAAGFALGLDFVSAYAVGMKNTAEIDANIALFADRTGDSLVVHRAGDIRSRKLLVSDWCNGCGRCVERCASSALTISDGRAVVDHSKCTLCSYCATVCRDFVLKII